jgi:hypothetical protein
MRVICRRLPVRRKLLDALRLRQRALRFWRFRMLEMPAANRLFWYRRPEDVWYLVGKDGSGIDDILRSAHEAVSFDRSKVLRPPEGLIL